jgi:3-oxoacyl-(acyl-carrier-protein) synthase
VLAEVIGYAATCDAAGMVRPDREGTALAEALREALRRAGLSPDEVDYVNAYGSATPAGDRTELKALEEVFGGGRRPLVSGVKGAIGHLLAASGAVELVATGLALRSAVVPPTLNLEEPEPDCSFDLVPQEARTAAIHTAVTISRGIGGQNAVVVLRREEG